MKKQQIFFFIFLLVVNSVFAQKTKQQSTSSDVNAEIGTQLDLYNSLFRELNLYYVDTLNIKEMIQTSVDAMLYNLDPYTSFIPEEEFETFRSQTTGEYGGVGAVISYDKKKGIFVSEPYENKPAYNAGLRAGDVFKEIDGQKIKESHTTSDVSQMLRGIPGTEVTVKVSRPGKNGLLTKKILREKIVLDPVSYYGVIGKKTGYILLNQFTDKAADKVKTILYELRDNHAVDSIVLDLRNNPGGLVNEAIDILSYFLPKGTKVLEMKGKSKSEDETYFTKQSPIMPDIPLVILINESSASASEIVAGALQDLDRATIIGARSFGKGLVQRSIPLPNGGYLKVTVAKYYTPSGRCIQAIDYGHKDERGEGYRTPDSLCREFKTAKGRIVKDGGGITPDITIKDSSTYNIVYALYEQNLYFDFATEYVLKHKKIDSPQRFSITENDFNDFKTFLKQNDFSYKLKSEKQLELLKKWLEAEGYQERSSKAITMLEEAMKVDTEKDIEQFKDKIIQLINLNIVERYYYQKGKAQFLLRDDKVLNYLLKKESKED